jgi:hypothetical protein
MAAMVMDGAMATAMKGVTVPVVDGNDSNVMTTTAIHGQ